MSCSKLSILWIVGKLGLFFLAKKHGWLSSCAKSTHLSSHQQKMFAFWRNSTVTNRYKNTEKTYKHGKRCKERDVQKERKTQNQVKYLGNSMHRSATVFGLNDMFPWNGVNGLWGIFPLVWWVCQRCYPIGSDQILVDFTYCIDYFCFYFTHSLAE